MRYQAKMTEASLHQNPFLISNCFISFRNQGSTFRSLALWPNLWRKTARSLAMIEASSDYPWTCWVHPHMGQKSKQIRSDPIYLYLSLSITIYHYLSLSITIYHYLWIYTKDIYTILLYYNIYIYTYPYYIVYIYIIRTDMHSFYPMIIAASNMKHSFQIVTLLATCRSERRCVGLAWLNNEICPNMCPKPRKTN